MVTLPGGIDGLLSTIGAQAADTIATHPSTTVVPAPTSQSRKRAHDFLEELRRRGQTVELRTGHPIGEGGMGIVHEAEQVALGRVVAVKTLKVGVVDPIAAQDLLREAWVTGALEHPNVVPIHHLEMSGDTPLLIMKRIDGVEWAALVRDATAVEHRFRKVDLLAWNLGILDQVLDALRFAHSRGIVHRDLKPTNVMIGNFGEVYVLDWGIAVSVGGDATGRFPLASEVTSMAGTPAYMAPEMLGADVGIPITERTDVYVAGAVLYELVVGHPPHRGPNAPAIIASIVTSDPAIPSSAPPELAQICRRALQPDPADRYESIAALQRAVHDYLEHRGSAALSARAHVRLDELLASCDGPPTDDRREAIYRLLAICRFGFHEALSAWLANTEALEGLTRATVAVASYELRANDPRAAVTLLSELPERHPLLDEAQVALAASTKRQRELEQLGADHNPAPGLGVRLWLTVGFGGIYTIVPLVGALVPRLATDTVVRQLLVTLVSLLVTLVIGVWWRRATVVNRILFQTAILLFVSQGILIGVAHQVGLSVADTKALVLFLWGTIGAMMAISFERYLALSAIVHYAACLITAHWPDLAGYAMSVSNLVFTCVVAFRWRLRGYVRTSLSAR